MKSSNKRKPAVKLPGKVEKVIPSRYEPEKAEISIRSIKKSKLKTCSKTARAKEVALEPGAEVEVTIEAEPHATDRRNPLNP